MSIRVILVEDHTLVRAGLRSLLAATDNIEVVAEANDGREALRVLKETPTDVVVMDITMPGLNGLEATARIKKAYPDIKILMLSMYSNEEYVVQSLRHGANGYLVKDSAADELERAITAVARGERYLGGTKAKERIERYIDTGKDIKDPLERLTPRQREILQLVVEGHKTREIAEMLSVSVKTVETHRKRLMDKLDLRSVAALTKYAIREGLTTLDD